MKRPYAVTNRTIGRTLAALALTLFAAGARAPAQSASEPRQPPLMDRDTEIALALSACPAALAEKAGVYVLGPAGYVRVRESANGFTAIVQHSLPDAQEPQCMDQEGAQTFLQRILKVAELRAKGLAPDAIQREIAAALARGELRPPSRPGIDYMLSTQNRPPNAKRIPTPFPPHVMFYAPYLTNADIGVDKNKLGIDGNPMGPAFVAGEGSPFALIIVPVGDHAGMVHAMPDLDAPARPREGGEKTGR
ncbi:MAG TPA: hypothetical protein VKX28_04965 [Xanthobacteraceae bacterium]|nr:hypothetical protein [Xanthobacteraceae bacterium]